MTTALTVASLAVYFGGFYWLVGRALAWAEAHAARRAQEDLDFEQWLDGL